MENLNFNELINDYLGGTYCSENFLTIGKLSDKLNEFNDDLIIQTTNGYYLADEFDSYRGYYEDMYIGFTSNESKALTVKALKDLLERALSQKVMTGYKGGEYSINEDTLLWLSSYGICGSMMIDVFEDNGSIVIIVEEE